jgi:EpsI family protein
MEKRMMESLNLSDYVIIDYHNRSRKQVNFYVAYYETQRKGKSIHSPASCFPRSGWEFINTGKKEIMIPGKGAKSIYLRRVLARNKGQRQLVYF